MSVRLTEKIPLSEAGVSATTTKDWSGRMQVTCITPGKGSSGYYSPEVIEQAAKDRLIQRGTPVHFDHISESERTDRPERSVRDIAGVFTGDASWDGNALVGEVQIFKPYRDLVSEMAPYIGLSISGSATDITGDRVIEGLAHIDAVDLVTKAGRGGRVDQLLESARHASLSDEEQQMVDEATTFNDRQTALSALVSDANSGEKTYAWVRDFDETHVWFSREEPGGSGIYQQAYESNADGVPTSLIGEAFEVYVKTSYEPVAQAATETAANPQNVPSTRSDDPSTHESQKEHSMGDISIEESEHRRLKEAAERVPVLEAERDTAVRERDEARSELAARDRRDRAGEIIAERAKEGGVSFTALEEAGLVAALPVKDGQLDETAFTVTVDKHVAERKAAGGTGTVRGFGGTPTQPVGEGRTLGDIDALLGIKEA